MVIYHPHSPVLSLPEPKAQVFFSDQNLSLVRHRCSRCRCCRKLFKFSSPYPEPLCQFQPYLAIASLFEFKFVQMNGPVLSNGR